jgi:hypothetical protein
VPSPIGPLLRGRASAEALMTSTCTITRVTGPPGELDENGERTPAPTATVYTGKCKVQTYEPHESAVESGDHVYTEQRYHLHLPIGAGPFAVDDEATITASPVDPQVVGASYRIAGLHNKTYATAQRLLVDQITD